MKKFLLLLSLCTFGKSLYSQITIMDDDVCEKIVSKPMAFDSLSNITRQWDIMQYKQYVGYKLYCLPLSKKAKHEYSNYDFTHLEYTSPRTIIKSHKPFEQTDIGRLFGDVTKLKGNSLANFNSAKDNYEKRFVVSTNMYKAIEDNRGNLKTSYDSIQNTYFTILKIEIADYINMSKRLFSSLEEWDNKENSYYLRFTLRNETSKENLYWICRSDINDNSFFFLVPYFEKMQKKYKGMNVVPTKAIEKLADINTGEPVNILPREVWKCYNVTFVNTKEHTFVRPFFLLEKEGRKVMIPFEDFTKTCNGIFTSEDRIKRPWFILEEEYNQIITEKKRSAEEKKRLEEERKQLEEQKRAERNKKIIQKYGKKYGTMICEGKVCLNMNKQMCVEAWGEPLYINTTIVSGLTHEQWVYGWSTYLYFHNGILKTIQN